jgi:hypothetical protein
MSKRLQLVHEVQTLPYRIVACSELEDVSELASYDELMRYQKSITDSIVQMIGKHNPAKLSEFSVSVSASTSKMCNLVPASSVFFTEGKHNAQTHSKAKTLV